MASENRMEAVDYIVDYRLADDDHRHSSWKHPMQQIIHYEIYRGVLILAPVDWVFNDFPNDENFRQGFKLDANAVEFYTPHADDTIWIDLVLTVSFPKIADGTLRAIRVPLEVSKDMMLCNIDNGDDLPIEGIPPGPYGVQFELSPGTEREGKQFYYDIRLTFVPGPDTRCEILRSGHEDMTATEGMLGA